MRRKQCKTEMCMATAALLLWIVTTPCGLGPSLKRTRLTLYPTLLERVRHFSVTIENGYIHAVCNILVRFGQTQIFIHEYPEALTVQQLLVSDEPVGGETPVDSIVCPSPRSTKIRKWDYLGLENNQNYDLALKTQDFSLEIFLCKPLLALIREMTFIYTFEVPSLAVDAVCKGARRGRGWNFEVHGLIEGYGHSDAFGDMPSGFTEFWNIQYVSTEVLNVTFASKVRNFPRSVFGYFSVANLKHIIFYKCNFDIFTSSDLPRNNRLERLDILHTPIHEIHLDEFILSPYFRYSSLVGTNLPGIPQGIFDLKLLETLDMSDTNVPHDIEFQYCPGNSQSNSSVQQLILSRTNLTSLPNRAFCGFPLLKTLELENCHITQLSGSPFQCLENLNNLTMPGNKITSLDGENMKGLKKLAFLNLSKNRIAHFEGHKIFSMLISLRKLIRSQNEITNLLLGPVEYVSIEELNLVYTRISGWKPPVFTRMGKLKTLLLQHNKLSRLSEDMLRDIFHVRYVNLSSNPLDCLSCELKNLRSVVGKHHSQGTNCFLCKEPDKNEGKFVLETTLSEVAFGPPDHFRIYGFATLLSIVITSMAGYAVYRNRWYCMYGLLHLKVAVKRRQRQAHAGRFLWDCFLSYHASDAKWVRDELLPKLESAPMRFRLCVAERDFIPGLSITENTCRAITHSRVSLFVLSREFCRSRWCMFDLSLAHHRLFENDRHDSIVFIRKNDVELSELSSMLAYLITSRTQVPMPPDGSSEALNNLFWLQVQAALEK